MRRRGSFWTTGEASEVRFFLVFKLLHLIRLSHLPVMLSDGMASFAFFHQSQLPVLALPHTIIQPQRFFEALFLRGQLPPVSPLLPAVLVFCVSL